MKCKLCNSELGKEDLLCDDSYCLECIDLTSGEDEQYGQLHSIKLNGAQASLGLYPGHSLDGYKYIVHDNNKEYVYNNKYVALDKYLSILRKYL